MHINDQASTLASLIAVLWFSLLKKCHHTFQSVRLQQKIYKPESNSRKERIDQSYIINYSKIFTFSSYTIVDYLHLLMLLGLLSIVAKIL